MSIRKPFLRWRLKPSEIRWLIYLSVVLAFAAWKFLPRPWHPTQTVETAHFKIYSTATQKQVTDTGYALELLYVAYSNRLGSLSGCENPPASLKIKLYKDRDEMRRINPGLGWAEAFYKEPYCRAYFSADEINPYHWMLHESVHQLNNEVAHLRLAKWLDEGLADYFGTSRLMSDRLDAGNIDLNTYPVWWLDDLATRTNLDENIKNGSVIPLRSIITDQGGPSMDDFVNLYYLHWWTLTHFLFETEKYHDGMLKLIEKGGKLDDFEKLIGPVNQVQIEWHDYVRHLKDELAGKDREFLKKMKKQKRLASPTNSLIGANTNSNR